MENHPSILIIESDRDRVVRLKTTLAELLPDVTPTIASNRASALLLATTSEYDVIVAGPQPDGTAPIETLRALRAEGVKATVILINSLELNDLAEVIHDIGIAAVVTLDEDFAANVGRRIGELFPVQPSVRRLVLRGRSRQSVDLIKITAGTLYHEISNPLMTILGMTELILDNGRPPSPEIARKVEAIRESAGRIQSVLNRLINIDEPAIRDTASGQMIDPGRSRLNHKVLP